jgi:hypothetical protein
MLITVLFYFSVCAFFFLLWHMHSPPALSHKHYPRDLFLSLSSSSQPPADFKPVSSLKLSFKQSKPKPSLKPNPDRFRAKDKENQCPSKQSLASFLLSELETTVQELALPLQSQNPNHKSSALNPFAREFILNKN